MYKRQVFGSLVDKGVASWGLNHQAIYNAVTFPKDGFNHKGEIGLAVNNPSLFSHLNKNPSATRVMMQNKRYSSLLGDGVSYLHENYSDRLVEMAHKMGSNANQLARTIMLDILTEATYDKGTPLSYGGLKGLFKGSDETFMDLFEERTNKMDKRLGQAVTSNSTFRGPTSSPILTSPQGQKFASLFNDSIFPSVISSAKGGKPSLSRVREQIIDSLNRDIPAENRIDSSDIKIIQTAEDATPTKHTPVCYTHLTLPTKRIV